MRGKEYAFYDRTAVLKRQFPVSCVMLLASCLMWGTLCVCAYYSVTLTVLYLNIMQEADLKSPCPAHFSRDPTENFNVLKNYPRGGVGPYIARLYPQDSGQNSAHKDALPTLITAVSSSQFYLVQGLIEHLIEDIKPDYPHLRLIIYDVGLYKREYELLERYCHCEVRRFITTAYPAHVADYTNFAWRPIIIQTTLNEFGSIIFLDPTARFKGPASLKSIQNRGWRDFMVWDMPTHMDVVAYTAPATFKYLGEEICTFQETGMVDTEILVLFKSNKTWQLLMKPWLKCALSEDCIAPSGSRYDTCFHMRSPRTTGCHRYDISALSIVLNRAFQISKERNKYIPPRMTFRSEKEVVIFPEQPWTNTQLGILLFTPFILFFIWTYVSGSGKFKFR